MPEPEIQETNGGISITLKSSSEKRGERRGEKRGEDLSENRQDILEAMRENPQVTHAQLIKIVGINSTNIAKNISYLKEKGYIRRVGPARGGYWEILEVELYGKGKS